MLSVLTMEKKRSKKEKEGRREGGREETKKFIKIDEITKIEKKAE